MSATSSLQDVNPRTAVFFSVSGDTAVQVNYNLLAVNFFMAFTGIYQLSRKISAGSPDSEIPASNPAATAAVAGAGPQVPLELPNNK